jgi:hypothetical protein
MTTQELDEWGADFFAFCARFNDVFGRKEPRAQAAKYLRGLLGSVPRKNGWQLAEAMGDTVPDLTQRLLYRTQWSADSARTILQKYIVEVFADEDGIGVQLTGSLHVRHEGASDPQEISAPDELAQTERRKHFVWTGLVSA